ncbi:Protein kinase protein rad53, partial [Coemansia sp. RSA 1804]
MLRLYDFKREIGTGNFAKVWLAIHKQSGTACACKVINKKRHLFSTGLTRVFEREISIMRQLNHPNIVPLHELHMDRDRIYIFMEYLEGGDLFSYLSDNGSFTEACCRPIFKQICSAVHYLHANGITHRDIKLDNILIKTASSGSIHSIKVADFGLARAVGDGDLMRTICGTPSYLAPEIYICLSESLRDLITMMLQVDASERITIEAVLHHLWMQTGSDGVPGSMFEPFNVWGVLRIEVPPSKPQNNSKHSNTHCARQQPHIDLFRDSTIIGRSRKSHIQIPDPR